jgi:hypothetical protein
MVDGGVRVRNAGKGVGCGKIFGCGKIVGCGRWCGGYRRMGRLFWLECSGSNGEYCEYCESTRY